MRTHAARFRRLVRHFLAAFVDNDLVSPVEDLHGPIAGGLAIMLVLFAAAALLFLGKYDSIRMQAHGSFRPSQYQDLAEKMAMALDDKTLLLGGAMLVMALLTVLFWDSLTLDERDRAVLGPLPLGPPFVLLAKASAVTIAAGVAAVAVNALPAVLFPIVVLAKVNVSLGTSLRWTAAHAVAGIAGCAFVFLTLASLRGLAGVVLPVRLSRRLLPGAQFAAIVGFFSLLLALPLLAAKTRAAVEAASPQVVYWPPLWFLGMEETLIGRREAIFVTLARLGVAGLAACVIGACAVQLIAFRMRTHAGVQPAGSVRRFSRLLERVALHVARDGRARASFLFAARTLARSRTHRLHLAGALGIGLAVAGATIGAAYGRMDLGFRGSTLDLTAMALAAQLNVIFFTIVGVRLSAAIPADLHGGWVFRFHATPALQQHLAGTRAAVFWITAFPLLAALAPVHAWLWGLRAAAVHFAFGTVAALALLEILFGQWTRLPFVSALAPARRPLTVRFPLYVLGYVFFVYVTPALERLIVRRGGVVDAGIVVLAIVTVRYAFVRSSRPARDRIPVFDPHEDEVQTLGLENFVGLAPLAAFETPGPAAGSVDERAAQRLFATLGYDKKMADGKW